MLIFANVIQNAFSPLIRLFEAIMVFIHNDLVGGSWGLAIVGLTVLIRAVLVPLTYRQLKSMQEMQRLAPQMQAIKERYKDDKQRQQQELMKFYQENKINPLASCLPLLLQLPVFISLFYMLRTDLKKHICGRDDKPYNQRTRTPSRRQRSRPRTSSGKRAATRSHRTPPSSCSSPTSPTRPPASSLVVLIVLYVASQLGSTLIATATADPNQRRLMLLLPVVFVVILFRYPAGLLVYWITTNLWTIGQQSIIRRRLPPPPARSQRQLGNGKPRARSRRCRRSRRPAPARSRWRAPPAAVAAAARRRRRGGPSAPAAEAATQEEEAIREAEMSDARHRREAAIADGDELEPAEALEELLEEILDTLDLDAEIVDSERGRRAHRAPRGRGSRPVHRPPRPDHRRRPAPRPAHRVPRRARHRSGS